MPRSTPNSVCHAIYRLSKLPRLGSRSAFVALLAHHVEGVREDAQNKHSHHRRMESSPHDGRRKGCASVFSTHSSSDTTSGSE